jgi:hypothetical protein
LAGAIFLLVDQSFLQGSPFTHCLTNLRRPYGDVALYLGYSFTCAWQSAPAFFQGAGIAFVRRGGAEHGRQLGRGFSLRLAARSPRALCAERPIKAL